MQNKIVRNVVVQSADLPALARLRNPGYIDRGLAAQKALMGWSLCEVEAGGSEMGA